MDPHIYILINGEKQGPFSADEIIDKNLSDNTLVWSVGLKEWARFDLLKDDIYKQVTKPPPPPNPKELYNRAIQLSKENNNTAAIDAYKTILLVTDSPVWSYHSNRNIALIQKTEGSFENARDHATKALKILTRDEGLKAKNLTKALWLKASLHNSLEETEKELLVLLELMNTPPPTEQTLCALTTVFHKLGAYDRVVDTHFDLIDRDEKFRQLYCRKTQVETEFNIDLPFKAHLKNAYERTALCKATALAFYNKGVELIAGINKSIQEIDQKQVYNDTNPNTNRRDIDLCEWYFKDKDIAEKTEEIRPLEQARLKAIYSFITAIRIDPDFNQAYDNLLKCVGVYISSIRLINLSQGEYEEVGPKHLTPSLSQNLLLKTLSCFKEELRFYKQPDDVNKHEWDEQMVKKALFSLKPNLWNPWSPKGYATVTGLEKEIRGINHGYLNESFCERVQSKTPSTLPKSPRTNQEGYLFFDTETTGVPDNYDAPASDLENWPRLVQIAWVKYDQSGRLMSKHEYIINPNGFVIPPESTEVHGITTEEALKKGVSLTNALTHFHNELEGSKYIVAHNMKFDSRVVGAEFYRSFMKNPILEKRKICTMLSTIDFCNIKGPYGLKWPKLSELHIKLFGEDFEGAHDALADIEATARCFWELKSKGDVLDE